MGRRAKRMRRSRPRGRRLVAAVSAARRGSGVGCCGPVRSTEVPSGMACLLLVDRLGASLDEIGLHATECPHETGALFIREAVKCFCPRRIPDHTHLGDEGTRAIAKIELPDAAVGRMLASLDEAALL